MNQLADPYTIAERTIYEILQDDELTPTDLHALAALLSQRATSRATKALAPTKAELDTASHGITYQQQYVKCGKDTCFCTTNPSVKGHGPYWYAYWTDKATGKTKSKYIGKTLKRLDPTTKTAVQE
jgi:hypothetical protein